MRYRNVDGMRAGILGPLVLLLALQGSWTWAETQVYKSTDAKGRVTYGDKPSPGAVVVEDMGVTAPDPAISEEDQQKRIDKIAETTNRLRDDRLLREKALAETRPLPLPPASPAPDQGSEAIGYAPQILGYPGYNRYVHPDWGVPYDIHIRGNRDHYHHRSPAWHHRGHGPNARDDDFHPPSARGEPRTPYRAPRLLRNPRP
ncbi:MAG: DUF4124 domain-containing protein [Porticoccaceae bacterium]